MLTKELQKALIAKAHALDPVVRIGSKGLTENVHLEVEAALKAHELIKVKVASSDKAMKTFVSNALCDEHNADEVQVIGHVIILYRKNPDKE